MTYVFTNSYSLFELLFALEREQKMSLKRSVEIQRSVKLKDGQTLLSNKESEQTVICVQIITTCEQNKKKKEKKKGQTSLDTLLIVI